MNQFQYQSAIGGNFNATNINDLAVKYGSYFVPAADPTELKEWFNKLNSIRQGTNDTALTVYFDIPTAENPFIVYRGFGQRLIADFQTDYYYLTLPIQLKAAERTAEISIFEPLPLTYVFIFSGRQAEIQINDEKAYQTTDVINGRGIKITVDRDGIVSINDQHWSKVDVTTKPAENGSIVNVIFYCQQLINQFADQIIGSDRLKFDLNNAAKIHNSAFVLNVFYTLYQWINYQNEWLKQHPAQQDIFKQFKTERLMIDDSDRFTDQTKTINRSQGLMPNDKLKLRNDQKLDDRYLPDQTTTDEYESGRSRGFAGFTKFVKKSFNRPKPTKTKRKPTKPKPTKQTTKTKQKTTEQQTTNQTTTTKQPSTPNQQPTTTTTVDDILKEFDNV